jgi:3-methyladenine DNA glycosylase/8-oxoguanine DNA glycosylase
LPISSKVRFSKDWPSHSLRSHHPRALRDEEDADTISTLTAVKGIGPWTAEMFLIFRLARPDVWSPGDLGLHRSAEFFFNSADASVADRWRPYRSIAA